MPQRAGLPAPESVVSEIPFTPATRAVRTTRGTRAGAAYRILRTTETDPYDQVTRAERRPAGDTFEGKSRKAAKLSIPPGRTRRYSNLANLVRSLAPDEAMVDHDPAITTDPASDRVEEEKRNVRVRTFLYAASREDDNDFHLILGLDPEEGEPMFMTMELSGLPPEDSPSFPKLKAARDAYKEFFGDDLPGTRYDFYDPPIPVEVTGSLFFDMSHARGSHPGPASLRDNIPTIWEVHPITKIVFEP